MFDDSYSSDSLPKDYETDVIEVRTIASIMRVIEFMKKLSKETWEVHMRR